MVKVLPGCVPALFGRDGYKFKAEVDGAEEVWEISRSALVGLGGIGGGNEEAVFERNRALIAVAIQTKVDQGAAGVKMLSSADM